MTEKEVKVFFDKVRRCQNLYNSIVYEREHIEEDLAAAKDVMDRAGYKPVDKTEVSGGLSITLEVDDDVNAQD